MVTQHDGFRTEPVYLVSKVAGHFRSGEPSKVIDFVWLTPDNGERRLCVHTVFADGADDYFVYDLLEFDIISETDVKDGNY